jgi:hypothetical protein
LKLVISSKTGKFHTIEEQTTAGQLSEAEADGILLEHDQRAPPYYLITSITRVYDNRTATPREFITANFIFEGIRVGNLPNVVRGDNNRRINISGSIGYHYLAKLGSETVKDKRGEEWRIATFNNRIAETIQSRVFDVPWSKEAFDAFYKRSKDGMASLTVLDVRNEKSYGVRTVDEFLTDDIAGLIKRYNEPPKSAPTYNFNVSNDQLKDILKNISPDQLRDYLEHTQKEQAHYK